MQLDGVSIWDYRYFKRLELSSFLFAKNTVSIIESKGGNTMMKKVGGYVKTHWKKFAVGVGATILTVGSLGLYSWLKKKRS